MAYRSFNQRFPKFKWVLFLAILITLPLTVFSVQKVSTSTEQHASGYTCGPSNRNPSCPSGYSCSYTGGNPNFGGTCVSAPKNPTPTPHLKCAGIGTCSYICDRRAYPADDCHSGKRCCIDRL